jgi:uncharacterized cupredoxin-like copper-binding protein
MRGLTEDIMKFSRRAAAALFALSVPLLSGNLAFAADATVHVSLWDNGTNAMDDMGKMAPMGFAMEGASMQADKATMGVKADVTSVPAGKVTFEVVNDSKDIIHEMLVSPVVDDTTPLPYLTDENRVDEEAAGHLGEVAELEPGKSGALTVDLKPGKYILFCNIPGHYVMGMWTTFEVKG